VQLSVGRQWHAHSRSFATRWVRTGAGASRSLTKSLPSQRSRTVEGRLGDRLQREGLGGAPYSFDRAQYGVMAPDDRRETFVASVRATFYLPFINRSCCRASLTCEIREGAIP